MTNFSCSRVNTHLLGIRPETSRVCYQTVSTLLPSPSPPPTIIIGLLDAQRHTKNHQRPYQMTLCIQQIKVKVRSAASLHDWSELFHPLEAVTEECCDHAQEHVPWTAELRGDLRVLGIVLVTFPDPLVVIPGEEKPPQIFIKW